MNLIHIFSNYFLFKNTQNGTFNPIYQLEREFKEGKQTIKEKEGGMNVKNRFIVIGAVALFFISTFAWGAGFKLPEQGTKAMGMSMAWTAQADNPSAIYFNSAGITQLKGKQILTGGTLILANGSSFDGDVTSPWAIFGDPAISTSESGKDQAFFQPVLYYTHQINDKFYVGIGVNSPFGLARTYDPTKAVAVVTKHVKLVTVVVNPTIAYKINDMISVGVGIDYMHGYAQLDKVVPPHGVVSGFLPAGYPGTVFHLEADGNAWSYNGGVLITPGYNLKLGVSYRGRYTLDLDGDATALLGTTGGSTTLKMADILNIAIAYQTEKFTVEFDFDDTFWSRYKNLDITTDTDVVGLGKTFTPQPKNWEDAAAYRLGFNYKFSKKCYGSLGLFIDLTPVPDATLGAELPDSDRKGFSVGAGTSWNGIDFDIAYLYFNYDDRTINNSNFNGTWKNEAHLFGVNMAYKF